MSFRPGARNRGLKSFSWSSSLDRNSQSRLLEPLWGGWTEFLFEGFAVADILAIATLSRVGCSETRFEDEIVRGGGERRRFEKPRRILHEKGTTYIKALCTQCVCTNVGPDGIGNLQ